MKSSSTAWGYAGVVVFTIVVWASAYPAIRVGLRAFTPGQLASLRFLTAAAIFAIYAVARHFRLPRGRDLLRATVAGALGIAAYNLLLNTGELTVSAGAASFIINCMPVFAVLLAVAFLGERLRTLGWIGIVVSFAGVTLIALGDPSGLHFSRGALLILLAALCAALMGFLQKPLLIRYSSISITACMMWSGALLLTPYLPGAFRVARHCSSAPLLAVLYLGVFPAALGYVTWAIVLSRFTLSQTATLLYFIPLAAVVISYFWLKELPSPLSIGGGIVAIAGVALLTRFGKADSVPLTAAR
ncbi:MAG: DMT family transporter [Acidobacteriaceae bacterium]